MLKRGFAAFALLAMLASISLPKDVKDAKSVLDDVGRAIGAGNLKSIQYSGSGYVFAFGQNYRPDGPYPKFFAKYSRMVDYEKGLSREETVRTQAEDPPRGGGGQPLYREARGVAVVTESSPRNGGALALTPYGWVKAAIAANPATKAKTVNGKPMTIVSFNVQGKYKVDGYVNNQNLVERIDTWVPNPTLGDTLIETDFSGYRDFSGVKFPMKIVQKQGGFPVLDVTMSDVQPNATVNIQAPQRTGAPAAAHVESQKIADGVWYLAGTPDPNSMAVEFKDFTVIIESSVTEERALANMAEVKRLVPNKPIRYHLNSHHHSDHAAGVRAFVAEGTTIITQEMNKSFYEQVVLKAPHTLNPDRLFQHPKKASFVWVKDKYVLTDGTRSLEIYWIPNAGHTANLLMSYLPKEKVLFITDIFNRFGEPRPNDPPPGVVTPYYAALGDTIKRLKLDVEQIAPSHGKEAVPVTVLNQLLEGTVKAPEIKPLSN